MEQPQQLVKQEVLGGINVERIEPRSLDTFGYVNPEGVDLYELEQKQKNVPNVSEVDFNQDRTLAKPRGAYQIALRTERLALIADLNKFRTALLNEATARGKSYSPSDLEWALKYVPNSRFAYYNRLIRNGVQNRKFSQDDIDFVNTVWMNDRAKEALRNFMRAFLDPSIQGFTVKPTQSRSGVNLQPAAGDRLALKLANPGTVLFPASFAVNGSNNESFDQRQDDVILQILASLDDKVKTIHDEMQLVEDLEDVYSHKFFPKNNELTKTLTFFRDKLLDKHISYSDLTSLSESILKMTGIKMSKYFLALSDPFKHRSARIPATISPPSATFSIKSIVTLTTNASGNVAFVYNPYLLSPMGGNRSGFGLNNNVALTGAAAADFFVSQDTGVNLPANFYVRYRLVSAGLKVYCYPSSNNDNGILTVSTTFEAIESTVMPAVLPGSSQFAYFNAIENGYYKQTTTIASREVQEHVYIPVDESFYDYQNVFIGQAKPGFAWTGYITGAAATASVARVEIISNYEALVDNEYTDYLPSDSPTEDQDPKNMFTAIARVKATVEDSRPKTIQKAFEEANMAATPGTEVIIPPSPKIQKGDKDKIDIIAQVMKDLVKIPAQDKNNVQKTSWLEKVMNTLSPISAGIISSVSKQMSPFSLLGRIF